MGNTLDTDALRGRMADIRVSARRLSIMAGLPDNFVGRILRGDKADPGASKVIALCDVLGIQDVRDLYDGTAKGESDGQ